jgi:hypothetical protein
LTEDEDHLYLLRKDGSTLTVKKGKNASSYTVERRREAGRKAWVKYASKLENEGKLPFMYKKSL